MNKDAEFVEYIIKNLVDNVEAVKVERKVDEMGVLLTVNVATEDMGKIIGREGATAKAIRTLLRVVGMKNNSRVNLKINEPAGENSAVENTNRETAREFIGDQSGEKYTRSEDEELS